MAEEQTSDFETVYKKARRQVLRTEKKLQGAGIFHGWPLGQKNLDYPKNYEFMNRFAKDNAKGAPAAKEDSDDKIINSWELSRPWKGKYGNVHIVRNGDGKISKVFEPTLDPANTRLVMMARTSNARMESTMREAEEKGMKTLRKMISFFQWHCYYVDGSFLEDAKSGVTYHIRKGRPTLAYRKDRFLCALCLHPLAYYEGTWAGAMTPSDEAIAHLLMVRGDEKFFWRKANQIPLEDPRSGV